MRAEKRGVLRAQHVIAKRLPAYFCGLGKVCLGKRSERICGEQFYFCSILQPLGKLLANVVHQDTHTLLVKSDSMYI